MQVLITYDVSTVDAAGRRRLRQAAKACLDYGQRVQNSVFECKVDAGQFATLKARLLDIVDLESDSIRFYHLGSTWDQKVDHHGTKPSMNPDGPLIV